MMASQETSISSGGRILLLGQLNGDLGTVMFDGGLSASGTGDQDQVSDVGRVLDLGNPVLKTHRLGQGPVLVHDVIHEVPHRFVVVLGPGFNLALSNGFVAGGDVVSDLGSADFADPLQGGIAFLAQNQLGLDYLGPAGLDRHWLFTVVAIFHLDFQDPVSSGFGYGQGLHVFDRAPDLIQGQVLIFALSLGDQFQPNLRP